MSRAPFAVWKGTVPNKTPGGLVRPVSGLVLHIMEGTQEGTDAWFHNPQSRVSAHFGNAKDGRLWQWVDTDDEAWAQTSGNARWVSVENEGRSGDRLTGSQIENAVRLMAWLHAVEGVPLQITDDPNRGGLGWHGMAGGIWGHPNCPGAPIVAQRQQIIDLATQGADDLPYTEAQLRSFIATEVDQQLWQHGLGKDGPDTDNLPDWMNVLADLVAAKVKNG